QYVETVNDHRRWECYVSTAYEHTNKHYREQRAPKFRDRHGNPIPIATRSIIGLTVLVYVLQWAGQLIPGFPPIDQWLMYSPLHTSQVALEMQSATGQLLFQPWRMLTAALVHSMGSP